MAQLLPQGKQYYETSAGIPLVGGQLLTYDAGTTNPRVTYSDSAGTVPNPNPVVLDARGEALIFWAGAYKVILKDALGNTIWTVDNVSGVSATDLASSDGAGMIGFLYAAVYAPGTIGRWLQDLATSIGSTFIGFIQAGAGAILRTLQAELRDIVKPEQFGAIGDGVADDTASMLAALATLKTVNCTSGKIYKLTGSLTVDLMKQSLNGNGSILSFATLAGALKAIIMINSGGTPSDIVPGAAYNAVRGFKILGPGIASSATGIYQAAPHTVVEHCLVYQFGVGIDVFSEGYNLKYYSTNVGQCGVGYRILPGGTDYGEMISLYGCTIYDSTLGVSLGMNNGAVSMFGCHIDYCTKQFALTSSACLEFHGCWLENNDPGAGNVNATLTTGSKAMFYGGHVVVSGTSGALTMAAYFNTDSTSYVGITTTFMFSMQNVAQTMDSGTGTVEIINSLSYDPVNYLPWNISVANSRLADGGFESAPLVVDYWCITSDTAIASRLIGTNGQLATSTSFAHSGTNSLKLTKAAGPCGYGVITPVSRGSRMGGSIWVMTAGAGVGIFVQAIALRIEGVLSNGSPNITNSSAFDTFQTAINQGWVQYGFRQLKCPPWATHWAIVLNANGFTGAAYHDDVIITPM